MKSPLIYNCLPYSLDFLPDWYRMRPLWGNSQELLIDHLGIMWIQSVYGLLCKSNQISPFDALFVATTVFQEHWKLRNDQLPSDCAEYQLELGLAILKASYFNQHIIKNNLIEDNFLAELKSTLKGTLLEFYNRERPQLAVDLSDSDTELLKELKECSGLKTITKIESMELDFIPALDEMKIIASNPSLIEDIQYGREESIFSWLTHDFQI